MENPKLVISYYSSGSENAEICQQNSQEKFPSHDVHFCNKIAIYIFRICCLIWFTIELITIFVSQGFLGGFKTFKYLSNISLFLTWMYYLFMILDHSVFNKKFKKTGQILNYNILCLEFQAFFFCNTIILPMIIQHWDLVENTDGFFIYELISSHSIPFITLAIDSLWNTNKYKLKHAWISIVILTVYFIMNFIIVKTTKKAIYPLIRWDTLLSYFLSMLVAIVQILGILFICKFNKYWHKKMSKKNNNYISITDKSNLNQNSNISKDTAFKSKKVNNLYPEKNFIC